MWVTPRITAPDDTNPSDATAFTFSFQLNPAGQDELDAKAERGRE